MRLPRGTGGAKFLCDAHAVAVLPCGKVLVAGGYSADAAGGETDTAELWDPATGAWSDLPSMTDKNET